jgi:Protein of unknown function (DUF2510)
VTDNPIPPGWYPDFATPGQVRYWNGLQWTSDVLPAQPPQPSQRQLPPPIAGQPVAQPRNPATLSSVAKIAMFGGVAGLVGSFLPWVRVISGFGNIDVSGFDAGDGKLTAGAAIAAMLLGYFGIVGGKKSTVIIAMIAAAGGLAVSIYDLINVSNNVDSIDTEFVRATVGYGLYVCAIGFAVCLVELFASLPGRAGRRQDVLPSQ